MWIGDYMGGIEKEFKSYQKDHLQYKFEQMPDCDLRLEAKRIEKDVLNCIHNDDLEGAKCFLSQLKLNDRLPEMIEHVDLKALHDELSQSRGKYGGTSWEIVDRIKSNECN